MALPFLKIPEFAKMIAHSYQHVGAQSTWDQQLFLLGSSAGRKLLHTCSSGTEEGVLLQNLFQLARMYLEQNVEGQGLLQQCQV